MSIRPLAAAALLVATTLPAQSIAGKYSTKNPQGNTVTLVLEADGPSKFKGSMSGNGFVFTLAGEQRGADVAGTMTGNGANAVFEAHREGTQLRLILVELGASGQPNYSTAREVMFAVDNSPSVAQSASSSAAPNPLARPSASADKFAGTFSGNNVTLTLRKSGAGYEGTIQSAGQTMPASATVSGAGLAGKFTTQGTAFDFTVQPAGDSHVNLTTAGTTYMLARAGGVANPLAGGAAAGSADAGGGTAEDQKLRDLFTSTAWCTFSFSGGSTYSGGSYGSTGKTRTVFRPDGTATQTGGSENTNSGAAGNVYGSSSNAINAFWRIENGQFAVSGDRVNWKPVRLQMTYNNLGVPIPKLDGVEHMKCQ